MLWYILIWLLIWWALWYALFYFRYSETWHIDDLRNRYKQSRDEYEHVQHDLEELNAQNGILKQKTKLLMQQNEDYSKLISELSRYYFHIKEATQKVDELWKLLRVYDVNLDKKLIWVWVDIPLVWRSKWIIPIDQSVEWWEYLPPKEISQKYF